MQRMRYQDLRHWIVGLVLLLLAAIGIPRLSHADDTKWSAAFGMPGLISNVRTIVPFDGTVVVGGQIEYAGGTRVQNVAIWNGTSFDPMGDGLNGVVNSLAVVNGTLYAAGDFTASGATSLPYVARWTGSAWVAVGTQGPDNHSGLKLVADGSDLLLLGTFDSIDSQPVQSIARWNGSSWSSLGFGGGAAMLAAARYGTKLYVGGENDGSGSLHWFDGSSWTTSNRVTGTIRSMAVWNGLLYIHGQFTSVDNGAVSADQLVSFDGSTFANVGGVSFGGVVQNIGVDDGKLLVVGGFPSPGGKTAYWDGMFWHPGPCGNGTNLDGGIVGFARDGADILLGGNMTRFYNPATARFDAAWGVIRTDGVTTSSAQTGGGVADAGIFTGNAYVEALREFDGQLYAGGRLDRIGTLGKANGIATWDGSDWQAVGTGLFTSSGTPTTGRFAEWDGRLVITGYFHGGGSVTSSHIVAWNGANWEGFAGGISGQGVYAVEYGSEFVIGGYLGTEYGSGTTLGNVARWTGTQFQTIGTVSPASGGSATLIGRWSDKLVCGGLFTSINGVSATNIALWNGTTWSALGAGLNGLITSMAEFDGALYVSGEFTASGATPLPGKIARWDGTAWAPVGAGLNLSAISMHADDDQLYVCGQFATAGGNPANRIAAWDGTEWSTFGTGLGEGLLGNDGAPKCMETWQGGLFVGGLFNTAGDKYSSRIARYQIDSSAGVADAVTVAPFELSIVSQNPMGVSVALQLTMHEDGVASAAVFDVHGRLVRTLAEEEMLRAGVHALRWDGRDRVGVDVGSGVYWVRLVSGGATAVARVVKVR